MNIFDAFFDELEKIAANMPVKGSRGRKNKDGVARVTPVMPEPKEKLPTLGRVRRRGALRRKKDPFRGVDGYD